ncbi:Mini-ribonuclease 3 [Lachnoanaerobaculum umeaense]|jgi:cysteine--tRNA ligase|uniref:Mini-ribonuclease 3 n=1 Tax=Lachnoanaerobaculum umeaense TaxID=617123 RepID=A0A385PZM9_9FIRM|nr:ribonuclease III domain-containing protein [Lachnoanaerobaculum umeaense]AYA99039.1 ribonuclease III [Lachnoanaerobaculum umeaense]PZW95132.1 ribonuclease-3 family protein [Lachnoanaerobaculum umeaense]
MEEILDFLLKSFDIEKKEAREFSPLVLAYVGDAVYELIIRSILVSRGNRPVNKLNKDATSLVKAGAQADIIKLLKPELNEEEFVIFKRGRNSSPHTMAKNASMSDYKYATGFESLIGFLYLDNQFERALELVRLGLDRYLENEDIGVKIYE